MSPKYTWLLAILAGLCITSLFLFSGNNPDDLWRQILSGIGALLITAWTLLNRRLSQGKSTRYIISSFILCFMALIVAITTNLVAYKYDTRLDFTEDHRHSLSPQSAAVLQELNRDIEIITFFETGTPEEVTLKMLLEAFEEQSAHLIISHHDPNKEPMLAKQYGIKNISEIVLKSGTKTQHIDTYFTEENLLQHIISLSKDIVHEICFTTGHQELQIDSYIEFDSMVIVRDKLEMQNYKAKSINLLQTGSIPSSCSVLVIAGPKLDFSTFEQGLIARHVIQGRDLYVLLNVGYTPLLAKSLIDETK